MTFKKTQTTTPITRTLLLLALSFFLGFQVSSFTNTNAANSPYQTLENGQNTLSESDFGLFWEVWELIDTSYYQENAVNAEQKVYGAIKGLVESIDDPYTVFMDPSESKQFNSSLEGELEGIGAELTVIDKALTIVSPLRDSPAERAGLMPGDIIYKIGEEFSIEMSMIEAILSIRGEKGTSVTLTIIREGIEEPFEVTIIRDSIKIESVTVEQLEDGITYISVNNFNEKTNEQFNNAISTLLLGDPEGIIIDLRFNGGGYLDISVDLLSYLLPADTPALIMKQRNGKQETLYTKRSPKLLETPIVVLVNQGSASASEIVAGAIQDHKRGIIMGTQTFGKGSIQEVDSFSDGSSMRMTIAKWFTPNDRSVDEVGLTPDIIVEMTEEDIKELNDAQKQAAIDYLKNL
ncbi:S41 family peptidase [Candidatus Peregrinibacteria bacterium HGW-Peregrinibacteria-1]|jgi:carboxyl-terminal processing protease|nr:MAG: S41 family peptidase [Candidatus Peregrinibacteria bacterium HGW-Peregrinibacteria-1]